MHVQASTTAMTLNASLHSMLFVQLLWRNAALVLKQKWTSTTKLNMGNKETNDEEI
jgi:hypothetical protein